MFEAAGKVRTTRWMLLGLCLAVVGPLSLHGADVAFPGGHLRLADPISVIPAQGEPRAAEDRSSRWVYSAAWACERSRITLHVGVHAGHTEVHRSKVGLVRRSVERALGSSVVKVHDVRVIELPAATAYRVECRSEALDGTLRQVQFIVSGRDTVVLTFSGHSDELREMDATIDDAVATLCLDRRAGLLGEAPAWLCGSCLGLLAGLILLGRWGKARGELRSVPPHPDLFGFFRSSESVHSKRSGV